MKVSLLAIALTFLGCGAAQLGAPRVDASLAALVPADTIVLSGFRFSELRSTPLYQKLIAQKRLADLDDFARRTGFDPRRDVTEMLIASDGVDSLVLARGNFKPQPPAGWKKSVYKGATIYSQTEGGFAILDASTAVAGTERAVRKAIDQKESHSQGAAALLDRAKSLQGPGQIWFVANGWGALPDRAGGNMTRFLRSMESATATVDIRNGLQAVVNGQCRTEQDAKTLGDAVRGMIGLGRLSVPENQPEMLRIYDGIKVDQQQHSIKLNAQIPADLVDRLIAMTGTGPAAPPRK